MKRPSPIASFVLVVAGTFSAAVPLSGTQAAPVTDAALRDPDPREWIGHGRDPGETYFSPLAQVTTQDVDRLGLAWTWDLQGFQGRLEATPIVSNGVMYATGTWSLVFALDARTGE
jgi:quinohemoprotein ethanol dehydrogenase